MENFIIITELDLQQQHNLGLNSAWKRAQDRSKWRKLVETAMSCQGRAPPDDDDEAMHDVYRLTCNVAKIRPTCWRAPIGLQYDVATLSHCVIFIQLIVWLS